MRLPLARNSEDLQLIYSLRTKISKDQSGTEHLVMHFNVGLSVVFISSTVSITDSLNRLRDH